MSSVTRLSLEHNPEHKCSPRPSPSNLFFINCTAVRGFWRDTLIAAAAQAPIERWTVRTTFMIGHSSTGDHTKPALFITTDSSPELGFSGQGASRPVWKEKARRLSRLLAEPPLRFPRAGAPNSKLVIYISPHRCDTDFNSKPTLTNNPSSRSSRPPATLRFPPATSDDHVDSRHRPAEACRRHHRRRWPRSDGNQRPPQHWSLQPSGDKPNARAQVHGPADSKNHGSHGEAGEGMPMLGSRKECMLTVLRRKPRSRTRRVWGLSAWEGSPKGESEGIEPQALCTPEDRLPSYNPPA